MKKRRKKEEKKLSISQATFHSRFLCSLWNISQTSLVQLLTCLPCGASWSSGLIRHPTAPRVGRSNPGLSISFIRFQSRKKRRSHKEETQDYESEPQQRDMTKRGGGETKWTNRQAFQEKECRSHLNTSPWGLVRKSGLVSGRSTCRKKMVRFEKGD